MWNALRKIAVTLGLASDENDDYKKHLERVKYIYDHYSDSDEDEPSPSLLSSESNHCFGYVTHMDTGNNSGLIDNVIYFNGALIPSGLKVGDRVSYFTSKPDENLPSSKPVVLSICAIDNEVWDEPKAGEEDASTTEQPKLVIEDEKCTICQIKKRSGKELFTSTGEILHLDKISSTFVPMEGDWLLVEVQIGKYLSTDIELPQDEISISPLRCKEVSGTVTNWEPAFTCGIINSDIWFSLEACEQGYIPEIGDKVLLQAIESNRDALTWRAITVVPCLDESLNRMVRMCRGVNNNDNEATRKGEMNTAELVEVERKQAEMELLVGEKNGISISENCDFGDVDVTSCEELVVFVTNNNQFKCQLVKAYFRTGSTISRPQIEVVSPIIDKKRDFFIDPRRPVKFVFRIQPRYMGRSSVMFIWKFKDFEMGRRISVNVVSSFTKEARCNNNFKFNKTPRHNTMERIFATKTGFITRSVKEFRPAAFVPVKLGMFYVPNHLWEAVLDVENEPIKSRETVMRKIEEAIPALAQPLSAQNYAIRWHALIYLEEMAAVINLRNYDMERANFTRKGEHLALKVPGLAEKRPSLIPGDIVVVANPCAVTSRDENKYEGVIVKVLQDEVRVEFNKQFLIANDGGDYKVMFSTNRLTYRRSHQAINNVVKNLTMRWLFPTALNLKKHQLIIESESDYKHESTDLLTNDCKAPKFCLSFDRRVTTTANHHAYTRNVPQVGKKHLKWFNSKLNFKQKEAVRNVLKGEARPLPYVIFGPPGTGKTITLVESALQILHLITDSRLLIATPSNSAANLIAERLLQSGRVPPGMLVRLCSHHYLSEDNPNISDLLLPYCKVAEIKVIDDRLRNEGYESEDVNREINREMLGRHRITIGTCTALGVLCNMGFCAGHFTHIFIDEAGQTNEPEAMIPLSFLNDKYGQAILAGDPMQLGPVVQSVFSSKYGMEESFLVRLLSQFPYTRDEIGFPETHGYNPCVVTKLVDNYRSLPEILKLPSSMFYMESLVPHVNSVDSIEARLLEMFKDDLPIREITDELPLPPAIIFHGAIGENYQEDDSPSWYNPQEIVQVMMYLRKLYDKGLIPDNIGIITPYQKQVFKLRQLLSNFEIPLPKIGSVEEFQGQERMVIILSTVRSKMSLLNLDTKHTLGFVSSPRRLNVALTRARALLVIIGNPHLLLLDPYWRSVLKYTVKNNAYCGCDIPDVDQ